MKLKNLANLIAVIGVSILPCSSLYAQRPTNRAAQPARNIIFGVLNDGGTLEPIAFVNRGKLEAPPSGSSEPSDLTAFNRSYLRKGTSYKLIFGGAVAGTSLVKSSDPKSECSKNMAVATTKSTKTPLKGLVMALATNGVIKTTSGFRRKPTAEEKAEADALARAEFARQKLTPKALRFQNLTALDLDRDGKAELVGSYWVEIDKLTRGLLFFVAGKGANGKYVLGHKEYRSVDQSQVMSGEIKSVDDGVYHELLLDVYDYDGDGTSELFTYTQSFEGAGFTVYRRSGDRWTKAFEGSNYHCGY